MAAYAMLYVFLHSYGDSKVFKSCREIYERVAWKAPIYYVAVPLAPPPRPHPITLTLKNVYEQKPTLMIPALYSAPPHTFVC